MTKRFGFTLAEVLITLGIIGVVAAMTIPTLISNTNGAQFKTGFKKALSTLNQAAIMQVAMEDYDFSSLEAVSDTVTQGSGRTMGHVIGTRTQASPLQNYVFPSKVEWYFTGTCTQQEINDAADGSACDGVANTTTEVTKNTSVTDFSDWTIYSFADQTAFAFPNDAANCTSRAQANCMGFIDVNGGTTANPNLQTVCTESTTEGNNCTVSAAGVRDIFPVFFYGQTVEPASDAARQVLFGQ